MPDREDAHCQIEAQGTLEQQVGDLSRNLDVETSIHWQIIDTIIPPTLPPLAFSCSGWLAVHRGSHAWAIHTLQLGFPQCLFRHTSRACYTINFL